MTPEAWRSQPTPRIPVDLLEAVLLHLKAERDAAKEAARLRELAEAVDANALVLIESVLNGSPRQVAQANAILGPLNAVFDPDDAARAPAAPQEVPDEKR